MRLVLINFLTCLFLISPGKADWEWIKTAPEGPVVDYWFGAVYDKQKDKIFIYGGVYNSRTRNHTWEWDGTEWTRIYPESTPPKLYNHGMIYDASRSKVVLFGGYSGDLATGYSDQTWEYDGINWTQILTAEHPGPRQVHYMAYDPIRHVTVLPGDGETWEYDGTNWIQYFPENPPGGGVIFDYHRQKIITCLEHVCEWEDGEWVQITTFEQPEASQYTNVASNPVTQTVLRYGDFNSDETWVWDGETWTQMFPEHPIPGIEYPKLIYHETRQTIILYGGLAEDDKTSDMYEWDGSDWHVIDRPARPEPCEYSAMTGNLPGRGAFHFGGRTHGGNGYSNETWEFTDGLWTQLLSEHCPGPRCFHALGCDWERGVLILFGGLCNDYPLYETWEYDGADWHECQSDDMPGAVDSAEMAYDPVQNVTVLYGGFAGGSTFSDQTWSWDGTQWRQYSPSVVPPGRAGHAMAFDERRGRIVMFGGANYNPYEKRLNTWEWDGENWSEIVTDGNDPWESYIGSEGFYMTYDSWLERIFCMNVVMRADNHIVTNWLWDGTVWTKMSENELPGRLEGMAIGYDRAGERSVMFGGRGMSHAYGNTWVFDNSGTPPTANPTRTPSPTRTPTLTPVPTLTPAPTLTPTVTMVPTSSPEPTMTPTVTPVCEPFGMTMEMPDHVFIEGSACSLTAYLCNTGDSIERVLAFVILEASGSFWLAPSWQDLDEGVDYFEIEPLVRGRSMIRVISEFTWPAHTGTMDGLFFHGALTDPEITEIIGEPSSWEFGYR